MKVNSHKQELKKKKEIKIPGNQTPFHSFYFRRGSFAVHIGDYLQCGIICGSGSFAVQFEDYLRSEEHLRSGIVCGVWSSICFNIR